MAAINICSLESPVGLIAGNGNFPIEFAESAKARGLSVVAVAHRGETEELLEGMVSECHWIKVGEVGKIIGTFKEKGVKQAAFAGGIKRTKLFGGFKPDLTGIALLARLGSLKDDVVLRGVAAEIEKSGIEVFSASVLLEKSVPGKGLLTHRGLSSDELRDARRGWEAARGIGLLDVGQTVISHQGVVVAVEAVEGTDKAIMRSGELAGTAGRIKAGKGCVVVKLAKPQQDLRFDMPTVGPMTIELMQRAGASALVIEAGKSLILDCEEMLAKANAARIAIYSAENIDDLSNRP